MLRKLFALTLLAGLAQVARAGDPCAPACCPAQGTCCEEVCKKVCVPTTEVVKTPKAVYGMKCEDLCLPKCSWRGKLFSCFSRNECCDSGCASECTDCAKCGKPREVRKLVKKFENTEECKTKCVVEQRMELVPVKVRKCRTSCATECCGEVVAPAAIPAPAPQGEPIPAPK